MIHYYVNPVDITDSYPYNVAEEQFAEDIADTLRKDFDITDSKRKIKKDSYRKIRRY